MQHLRRPIVIPKIEDIGHRTLPMLETMLKPHALMQPVATGARILPVFVVIC
jgi:hypothetical protein